MGQKYWVPKRTKLLKGKIDQNPTCGPSWGWHLFDPQPDIFWQLELLSSLLLDGFQWFYGDLQLRREVGFPHVSAWFVGRVSCDADERINLNPAKVPLKNGNTVCVKGLHPKNSYSYVPMKVQKLL